MTAIEVLQVLKFDESIPSADCHRIGGPGRLQSCGPASAAVQNMGVKSHRDSCGGI